MTTCQYYIKKTNHPRICSKKSSHTKSSFLGQNLISKLNFELHLCSKHFGIIADQIRTTINPSAFFNFRYGDSLCSPQFDHFTNEWKFAQLVSILTQRIDEFNRITRVSHNPDDVVFIEEKTENQVLASKFEQVKRDGRYIDLTEPTEEKIREQQKECPICLEQFSPKNMTFLECAHALCNGCLSNLERHNVAQRCPVCRYNI